jgi:hypothetical protein
MVFTHQFCLHTLSTNYAASIFVVQPKSLGFRTWGFNEESWIQFFTDIISNYRFETFPEFLESKKIPSSILKKLPIYIDGKSLWNCINEYVISYLMVFYGDDTSICQDPEIKNFWMNLNKKIKGSFNLPTLNFKNLVNLLTQFIWSVTAYHEFVGSIMSIFTTPSQSCAKLLEHKTVSDVSSYTYLIVLIIFTSFKRPKLMSDWSNVFDGEVFMKSTQKEEILNIIKQFQINLEKCAYKNIEENKKRECCFDSFNPFILETSVSI